MSDDRLLLISDLLKLRIRIYDMEGQSDAYRRVTEAVDSLKVREDKEVEKIHTA